MISYAQYLFCVEPCVNLRSMVIIKMIYNFLYNCIIEILVAIVMKRHEYILIRKDIKNVISERKL